MKALVLSLSLVTLLSACTMPGAKTPATSTGTEATGTVETSTSMTLPVESTGTVVSETDAMVVATGSTESTGSTATGA